MDLPMFRRVMDRIEAQTQVRNVLLYSFSEPFLSPILPDAIRDLKARCIQRVMISTNLSRPKNLKAALDAGLDELRVSFSGFSLGEYFHTGRDMTQFRLAMQRLSRLAKDYPHCRVALIFHVYRTNKWELDGIRSYARDLGVPLIEEEAFFIPYERIAYRDYTDADNALIAHLIRHPNTYTAGNDRQEFCYYQRKQLVVGAEGEVYLCRHVFDDKFIVGDIFKDSLKDIRRAMRRHHFCAQHCKRLGLNRYTVQDQA